MILRSSAPVLRAQCIPELRVCCYLLVMRAPVRVDAVPAVALEDMPASWARARAFERLPGLAAPTRLLRYVTHERNGIMAARRTVARKWNTSARDGPGQRRAATVSRSHVSRPCDHAPMKRAAPVRGEKQRAWSPNEDRRIIRRWKAGATAREIATELDRPIQSTQNRVATLRNRGLLFVLSDADRAQREERIREQRSARVYVEGVDLLARIASTWAFGYVIGVLNGDGFIHRSRLSACMKTKDQSFADGFAAAMRARSAMSSSVSAEWSRSRSPVSTCIVTSATSRFTSIAVTSCRRSSMNSARSDHTSGESMRPHACAAAEFAKGVIQGFFDSEGSVDVRGSSIRIGASTVNGLGVRDLLALLNALGYNAPLGGPGSRGEYRIVLGVEASVRYAGEIGSRVDKKARRMREALHRRALAGESKRNAAQPRSSVKQVQRRNRGPLPCRE